MNIKIISARLLFILISIALFIAALNVTKIFGGSTDFERSLTISRYALWFFVIALLLISIVLEKKKLLPWSSTKRSIPFFILSFVIVFVVTIVVAVLLTIIEKKLGYTDNSDTLNQLLSALKNNTPLLFFTIITAAVVEEIYFRGYLIPRLQELTNSNWLAIIISALLFGLAHIGFKNVAQFINTFSIGMISAIYYSRYKNIGVLIAVHFAIDLLGIYSRLK